MRIRLPMLLLPALALLVVAGTARANGHGRVLALPPANNNPGAHDPNSTLPDSVRRVERQTGGEVLRAEPMQQDGHEIYRLKVLTRDGRVRVMQADPNQPANDSPTVSSKRKPETSDRQDVGKPG
jgi:hypothetical protein